MFSAATLTLALALGTTQLFTVGVAGDLDRALASRSGDVGMDLSITAEAPAQHWVVERVSQLSARERVELYIGRPRLRDARKMPNLATRVRDFYADPAVRGFDAMRAEWFAGFQGVVFTTPRELVQLQVMVARNLFFQDRPVDAGTVRAEIERIRRVRAELAGLELFAERNVVFAASYDTQRGSGREVFGRGVSRGRVERQAGTFQFLQPDAPGAERRTAMAQLQSSLSSAAPTTFFFEGHGRETALQFAGKLTSAELAELLAANDEQRIVISASCQGHGFARRVLDELRRKAPAQRLPVIVVPEEYGQDFVTDAFNDDFKRVELGLATGESTLGKLMERANIATSVYVPDEQNRPMQIL